MPRMRTGVVLLADSLMMIEAGGVVVIDTDAQLYSRASGSKISIRSARLDILGSLRAGAIEGSATGTFEWIGKGAMLDLSIAGAVQISGTIASTGTIFVKGRIRLKRPWVFFSLQVVP